METWGGGQKECQAREKVCCSRSLDRSGWLGGNTSTTTVCPNSLKKSWVHLNRDSKIPFQIRISLDTS